MRWFTIHQKDYLSGGNLIKLFFDVNSPQIWRHEEDDWIWNERHVVQPWWVFDLIMLLLSRSVRNYLFSACQESEENNKTIFYIVQFQRVLLFCLPHYEICPLCQEVKAQLIAFSNHTLMFLYNDVLLSLRPSQNEVHPSHGGAHPGGHAGSWTRAEESYHPHLLWYDAVWAQLQPRTHVWNGKIENSCLTGSALVFSLFKFNWRCSRLNITF